MKILHLIWAPMNAKKNKSLPFTFFIFIFLLALNSEKLLYAQVQSPQDEFAFRAMFYNVENYFDPFDDSLTLDEAFTQEGDYHWTWNKMEEKALKIFKVIAAAGTPYPPAIIGFAEVENRFVMLHLLNKTPLSRFNYTLVHQESPDRRGIDVSLIFNNDELTLLHTHFYPVKFSFDPDSKTRDILYASLQHQQGDTLHVFVNHWPSKYGGAYETEEKRMQAALTLRAIVDSLYMDNENVKILIMGDFNDTYISLSLVSGLRSLSDLHTPNPKGLFNLTSVFPDSLVSGTHKFREEWNVIDQFLVSNACLFSATGLQTNPKAVKVLNDSFLLEKDERNFGLKPFRTNIGFRYHGGYSDHLPIVLDFYHQ